MVQQHTCPHTTLVRIFSRDPDFGPLRGHKSLVVYPPPIHFFQVSGIGAQLIH